MSTIYYLQWHVSGEENREEASELFHQFHHDPLGSLTEREFKELYTEVVTTEVDDLEQLFAEWNRGSGRESEQFIDLRYCERCQNYTEGSGETITHAAQNHGYDAFLDPNEPDYIRGERSMSVGDIVEQEDEHYACAPIGWQETELLP